MPREKKNTILAAVVGVTFILGFLVNDPFLLFESSYEKSKPLLKGRSERVKKVTTIDGANKRVFTRTTEGWSAEQPGAAGVLRADTGKIETGLKNIFEARRYQEVSSNKDKQADYEVRDQDFQLILEGEGSEAAYRLVRDELQRNPTLLGLEKLMSARLPLAAPEIRPDVELAKTIIQGYTKRLSRYRCDNCGFKARQFYWRCPACGGWETYPPRRSEEFDQTL